MAKAPIFLLLLAAIAPYIYDRYLTFGNMLSNSPSRFTPIYNIKSHEIKFQDRLKNCEDILLDEGTGMAILSCDPGRDRWNTVMGVFARDKGHRTGQLYIWDYSGSDSLTPISFKDFPNAHDFHPLGIEYYAPTSTLYVINHMQHFSVIEVFSLSLTSATATHVKTFQHDLMTAPNSIHAVDEGRLYVTIDHFFQARQYLVLSKIETFAAPPLPGVIYVDLNNPAEAKLVARVPFANGIAALNARSLVVASSSKSGLYFYTINEETHDLKFEKLVRVPSAVDNLSVDSNGKVLMAGHPYALQLVETAQMRANCGVDVDEVDAELAKGNQACGCTSPSWAAEWSEDGGLRELYKGSDVCSSSTAVRDATRGFGALSLLYGRGIMVFKE